MQRGQTYKGILYGQKEGGILWQPDRGISDRYFQTEYYSYSYSDDFSKPNIENFNIPLYLKAQKTQYAI